MKNKSFLIITTLHPESIVDGTERNRLFNLYLKALESIQYSNFKVLIVADKELNLGDRFKIIVDTSKSKEKRLVKAKEYLENTKEIFDYILRLDDDDILNPNIFNEVDGLDCDVYTDEFHSFYDISSGKIAQQKRNWFPNTTIMSFELAFKNLYLDNALFFNFQHSSISVCSSKSA